MSYLVMRRGPAPGKIFRLDNSEIRIGRGTKNDIIIDDNEVSRDHLHLVKVGGGFELRDVQSSNGTYINGQRVDGVWVLRSQCIIELGDSITLEYYMGEPTGEDVKATDQLDPSKQQFYLVVHSENQPEPAVYPLAGRIITVGRSTSNDVVIVEPELSRQHFKLTRNEHGYIIEDLGSTNGTNLNGEILNGPHQVYAGDLIVIGTSVKIQMTNTPETSMTQIDTSSLGSTSMLNETNKRKRKTSQAEVAGVSPMMQSAAEPTEIGTGVDHVSLKDQVLISYDRADWEHVIAPMVHSLYEAEIDVWVDQYLTENSTDWLLATEQARLECWLLVVVVSPEAMNNDLIRKNWRHFQNREKPILLFVNRPVERLPIGSRKLTRIQFNPGVPDVAYQQLIVEINKLRSSPDENS